jgi:hypothetical protein
MILQKVGNDAHFGSELAVSHQQALLPNRGDPGSRKILQGKKEKRRQPFPRRRRCSGGPFYRRQQQSSHPLPMPETPSLLRVSRGVKLWRGERPGHGHKAIRAGPSDCGGSPDGAVLVLVVPGGQRLPLLCLWHA